MVKKLCFWEWIVLCHLLLTVAVDSKRHEGNPANDLVDIINSNRTTAKLRKLSDSPGLGCMALQYIELCKDNCTKGNAVNCQPPEDDFVQIFAPNCGVELPTFGTVTGHIVGCQSKYLDPSEAFSRVLVKDKRTLSILRNKSHTEVGVGLVRGEHKGYFFWGVLFTGDKINSTFVLEDRGKGIKQKNGCFSGSVYPCNGGAKKTTGLFVNNVAVFFVFLYICFLQLYLPQLN